MRLRRRGFTAFAGGSIAYVACVVCIACSGGTSTKGSNAVDTSRAAPPANSASATPATPDAADLPQPPAQPTAAGAGGIEFYSAAALSRVADELARGSTTTRTIGGHATYHYVAARRVHDGTPEIHDYWIDVVFIQSGRGTLLTGGHVNGGSLASPGEHRGGTIQGGTPQAVGAGDFVVIPAGVPHQYRVAAGDSIRYLTIKVVQAQP